MPKVFISYRHVEPDQSLAVSLADELKASNLSVFIDQQILTGEKWVEEIERHLRSSDFLVVLLSKESIRSAMVRQEVKLAYELSQLPDHKFTILPVRVNFLGALPYDLGAYLDPIQYAVWKGDEPFDAVKKQILAAIRHSTALPESGKSEDEANAPSAIRALAEATEAAGAPLPAADPRFLLESGAVKFDSPYYIRRDSDEKFEELVGLSGQTIIIKAPRQFGKSSLLSRADVAAKQNERQAFYFDFQFVDSKHLESLDALMRYIARKLARHFKTLIKPDQFWDDDLGAKDNITDFIEEALLADASSPILFLLDEVDRLFNSSFRDDFFSTVRGWHNLRARNSRWNNLNLVIAHSTEPSLWIQDITQSPFNVGAQIRLDGFDRDQLSTLNGKYGKRLKTPDELQSLLDLVGGHPYLMRQALYVLFSNQWSLPQLESEATNDTGPFGDHLRRFLWSLQDNPELKASVIRILRYGQCDDEKHFQRLSAAGLARGERRNAARMRCKLYQDYFSKHL
ncbi:MAG TPA: AAA-like domain-containing protein [Blastocatellia bacterium]|nr:AAA-like domain-containing protein [Blastocatellia bacterium]